MLKEWLMNESWKEFRDGVLNARMIALAPKKEKKRGSNKIDDVLKQKNVLSVKYIHLHSSLHVRDARFWRRNMTAHYCFKRQILKISHANRFDVLDSTPHCWSFNFTGSRTGTQLNRTVLSNDDKWCVLLTASVTIIDY